MVCPLCIDYAGDRTEGAKILHAGTENAVLVQDRVMEFEKYVLTHDMSSPWYFFLSCNIHLFRGSIPTLYHPLQAEMP
jgi:hypothetical protein